MLKKFHVLLPMLIIVAMIVGCAPAATTAPTEKAAAAGDVSTLPDELKNGLTFPKLIDPPAQITTNGPDGNPATWYTKLSLTPEEVAKVRAMHLRVGWELINTSEWDNANLTGFKDAAKLLNMEIVATSNGDLDPVKQKADMENFASMKLDV